MPLDAPEDDLTLVWGLVREAVEAGLPSSTFQLWIDPLRPVSVQAATLFVAAPAATRAWVERRYAVALETALRSQNRGLERIVLVCEGQRPESLPNHARWTALVESLPVNPQHTFERFVIGDGNRLAHAAALSVAELPGEAYNPLFLHGPPGLGKTHLLGAVSNYLRHHRPDLNVHYTTAERFTTEFVTALRKDGPERFKERYRALDALLIDDVQALEGKDHTQEEFVHTFNALHTSGKQVVFSSDRPPEALARLAERLRDRFQWGLCTELGRPDLRTRTALLWRIAVDAPVELPEPRVIQEIASLAADNVRRLEGAMTRVLALSSVLGRPVTTALVHQALTNSKSPPGDDLSSGTLAPPTVLNIQEVVCSTAGVPLDDLLSPNRTAPVSQARQLAIYLTRELTSLSLAQIARHFKRDHSTVLHAIRTTSARLELDSETSLLLDRARRLLTTPTSNGITELNSAPAVHVPASSPSPRSTSQTPDYTS